MKTSKYKIAIIGLGYVGLPLAVQFGRFFNTIGFDIKKKRIKELNESNDTTKEVSSKILSSSKKLTFTHKIEDIKSANVYILTLPTPLKNQNQPDLSGLIHATKNIAKILLKGDTVIYESTVYPGATDEIFIPIIEKISKLEINKEFYVGYSPERINPGDKKHTLTKIKKIVSGSNRKTMFNIGKLYSYVTEAGIYRANSIKVAEAAKVIENTQRDVNIALVNEFALIFDKLNIDTNEVLGAASTKWNFLNFKPGLVGGHCVGIDPYYLTYKAAKHGHQARMILAGRKINNYMPTYVFNKINNACRRNAMNLRKCKVLILGFAFKENCTDVRNTRVFDIYQKINNISKSVDIYDPVVNNKEVMQEYSIKLLAKPKKNDYDIIVIATPHNEFKKIGYSGIINYAKNKNIIFDIKNLFKNIKTLTL